MIEQMNHLAQLWWDWMSAMFWQVGLLILLIATIDLLIRKWAWPQLRYALWSLILIKLVLSPTLSLPSGLAPKLKPVVTQMLESAGREELVEFKMPIVIPSADDEFRQTATRSYSSNQAFGEPNQRRASCFAEISAEQNGEQNQSNEPTPETHILPAQSSDNAILVPAGPHLNWRVYAMGTWLLGVAILGTWLFVRLYRLNKEQPNGSRQLSLPESFYNQLDRCAQHLKLRRKPRVVTTTSIRSPAVFGMFQPVLLMPVGYIRRLSRKDTEYMLLHELAHIKRGDLVAHSLCMLLRLLYWYNPLLWLVGRQLRHLRELCCDATVASMLKDKTAEYRQTLLETARRFLATPVEPGLGLVGLFEDSNRLITRINWLKKPVWRYRKMKNVAVITAVLILLACVLPMAQGQNPQAQDPNVSSEQTEEKSSQSKDTSETEQEQQQIQKQLQAMQLLKVKLQQLQIEKEKLEKQLQVMARARQAEAQFAQTKIKAQEAQIKAKDRAVAKAKALAEAQKAEAEVKKWEHWVHSDAFKQWQKEMEKWAKEQAKAHEKAKEGLAPTLPPNPKPHPMPPIPPLPMEVEVEEIEMETDVDVEIDEVVADVEVVDTPEVVMPVPPIPPTPVPASPEPISVPVPVPPTPPTPLSVPELTPPVPPVPPTVVAPTPALPAPPRIATPTTSPLPLGAPTKTTAPAPTLPTPAEPRPTTGRDVKISKDKEGNFIATTEMHFVSKVKPGIPFIVRNNLGNITMRPSKDGTCDVRATIRARAKTAAKAEEMVLQVGMNIDSSEKRYYLKPVKSDGNQWSNLSVDFIITIPTGVRPDIKTDLGNIELHNLKGQIKAMTDLGSVKAVNTTGKINLASDLGSIKFTAPKDLADGEVELFAKMGDIELIAPRDLSANLEAETKMGSIKYNDLRLKVNKVDMFKTKAEGTLGTGQGLIRMHTDMGSIHLKWQSTPEEVPAPKPSPSDAAIF